MFSWGHPIIIKEKIFYEWRQFSNNRLFRDVTQTHWRGLLLILVELEIVEERYTEYER